MSISRKHDEADELDRELAFHLEELTQTYIAEGMNKAEARRQALLDFGGSAQVKEAVREVHLARWLEAVRFHVKAALRFLQHAPGLVVAVVLTLALGIGANSAMFSVLDAVVLRPLPYPQADNLVVLTQHDDRQHDANHFVAPVRLEDWNRLNSTFDAISGWYKDDLTETSGSLPERLTMALVAPRFLTVMGVSPLIGRDFLPSEEHFGGPQAALISYSLWQRRFHSDPGVLGKQLHAGRWNMPIIGVMPPSFLYPDRWVDLWTISPPDAPYAQRRDATWFTATGRLKSGITPALGLANLATVQHQLGLQFPATDADLRADLTQLKENTIGNIRSSVWLLYGSVSLLLMIACANIAALLLARTTDREHEISVRFSLGASRRAIILQLLAETFVLALLGSLLGLVVAAAVTHVFHLLADTLPRAEEITLNARILLYSFLCAVATTLLCGLYPAIRGTRRQLAQSLAGTSRTQSARHPMQWLLVGVQITLAVVLLTGAGLLVRSLQELGRVSPGFDAVHVLTFKVTGSYGETMDMGRLTQRIGRTLEALRSLPGLTAAATSSAMPGMPGKYQDDYRRDGQNGTIAGNTDQRLLAESRTVSDGYFKAMGIPVLLGKACSPTPKTPTSKGEYVVNRSFVTRYFGGTSPIGHTLAVAASGSFTPPGRIVGVVADAREQGLQNAPEPTAYACFNAPDPAPIFLVRTPGDPSEMADVIRRKLRELEPGRSVYSIAPLQEDLDSAFTEDHLRTVVLVSFACTAVLLACIGLYGTLSYLTRIRHREVGVRLTLGASRAQVARLFLVQGIRVAAAGCIAGAGASLATTRFLATMLYGVTPLDVRTWSSVLLFTLIGAAAACAIPARRAALVEPAQALRAG